MQVKEFFDSLSVDQKRTFALRLYGRASDEEVQETLAKICQLLQNQNLDGDNIQKEFLQLLQDDFANHLLKVGVHRSSSGSQKKEAAVAIKNYFESLSDQQKINLAKDLFSGDEQKGMEIMRPLWKFDGDLIENTKLFVELVKNHINMLHAQKECQDMKDKDEKHERGTKPPACAEGVPGYEIERGEN